MVDYRYLGRSALKVSPITLGTMMFGNQTPDDVAFRIIDKARERGINFIDTADVYQRRQIRAASSGRGIKAHRDDWVLATKFVNSPASATQPGRLFAQMGLSRRSRIRCATRHRLYRHHLLPPRRVRRAARRAGARHCRPDPGRQAALFRRLQLPRLAHRRSRAIWPISSASTGRSPASRSTTSSTARPRPSSLPAAAHYGLGVVSYCPLARGVLTGKYDLGDGPGADTRAGRGDKRIMKTEWRQESHRHRQAGRGARRSQGHRRRRFRAGLGAQQPAHHLGHRRAAHRGAMGRLHPGARRQARRRGRGAGRRLVATGHASTPGFNDPAIRSKAASRAPRRARLGTAESLSETPRTKARGAIAGFL